MKSYSDATKQNLGESLTIRNIKTAVKDVVKNVSENSDRSRNLIIFGLHEETNENLSRKVSDVFQSLGQKPHFEATRFGKDQDNRPIRVKFDRSDTVYEVLRTAKNLKLTTSYKQTVYLSADRTPDQRVAQKKLVEELKEKVRENPEQHYVIKGGKVLCQPQQASLIELDKAVIQGTTKKLGTNKKACKKLPKLLKNIYSDDDDTESD